jgi:dihydroflavonol-4-reductase
MRVLVTGAAGLLGSHIVRALLDKGHFPVALIRESTNTETLRGLPISFAYGSLEDKDSLTMALSDCDGVIHAASIHSHPSNDYAVFDQINVKGTENLVEVSLKTGLEKFIYVGTAGTIAPGTKAQPGVELDDFNSFHLGSPYVNSKFIAEQYILEQVEYQSLDALIISPTFMIGPYDSKPSSGRMIHFWAENDTVAVPPGGKNFVDVKDVALVCAKALDSPLKGEKLLVTGENLTYLEFFELLNEISGLKKRLIPLPKPVFYAAAAISQLFKGKKAEFNLSNAKILGRDNYYVGQRALEVFGYQRGSVRQAAQQALDWFAENKKLKIKKT